jgi:hypothetical protein
MKTKGLVVECGYVVAESKAIASGWGIVPIQFWNRLKSEIQRRGMVDQFKAEAEGIPFTAVGQNDYRPERALFERWVGLMALPVPAGQYAGERLWPWSRGWTEEAVDSYLTKTPLHLVTSSGEARQ